MDKRGLPPYILYTPTERAVTGNQGIRGQMTYYLKALLIIVRHPVRIGRHPKALEILRDVCCRQFRLHWLRDVAKGN